MTIENNPDEFEQGNVCADQADQLTEANRLLHELTIENNHLRKQMDQLKEPLERLEQLEAEKHALTTQLVKATEETADYHKKYEENTHLLQEQREQLAHSRTALEELHHRIEAGDFLQGGDYELYVEAQEKIATLTEQNDALKKEAARTQQEIGEVLLSAKKQASRTVEAAQMKADQSVKAAQLEIEGMSNQAKRILMEVTDSKETVLTLYGELQDSVEQLAEGKLRTEGEKRDTSEQEEVTGMSEGGEEVAE